MRMLNKVVQRPLLVATAPSVVMRSRQEKRSKGTGLYKRGRGSCDMEFLSHNLVTFRDEMENDHHSQTT